MDNTFQTNQTAILLLGGSLAIGVIMGSWVLGAEIKATRLSDRDVTVEGLVRTHCQVGPRHLAAKLQKKPEMI